MSSFSQKIKLVLSSKKKLHNYPLHFIISGSTAHGIGESVNDGIIGQVVTQEVGIVTEKFQELLKEKREKEELERELQKQEDEEEDNDDSSSED